MSGKVKISWRSKEYLASFIIDENNEADNLMYTNADGSEVEDPDELDDLHCAFRPVLDERLAQATQPFNLEEK